MKFFILLILLISFQGHTQNWIDLASVSWKSSPSNQIENSTDRANFTSVTASLKIPIVLKNDNAIILGLEHQYNAITSSQSKSTNSLSFQSSMLQTGYLKNWNKKHKTLFMIMSRLNSGYQKIKSNHFQTAALALTTSKKSENFDWKYGVYYNAEFFGPMFVPLFGFNWKINDKWRLKTVVPIHLELSYQPNKGFRTGLFFEGINASYRISNELKNVNQYIDKADNNVSLFSEAHMSKKIWIHGKLGYSVLRKYRIYDNNETIQSKIGPVNIADNRTETAPLFLNGMSFEIRLLYRMPT